MSHVILMIFVQSSFCVIQNCATVEQIIVISNFFLFFYPFLAFFMSNQIRISMCEAYYSCDNYLT